MTAAPARPTVEELLVDPSVSFTLKAVIRSRASCDVVDAAADAGRLAEVFQSRADEVVSWTR